MLLLLGGLGLGLPRGSRAAEPAATATPPDTVRVAADASLEAALAGLAPAYAAAHPGEVLVFTFGPSGVLRDRIMRRNLTADVFIAAGAAEVGALVIGGRADGGASVVIASNRLMLVAPPRGRLSALTELRERRIRRVALGNPATVAAGRDGVAALQRAGVWPEVKEKVRYCASNPEIVGAVERSEVDAGIVYASEALGNVKLRVVMGLDSFAEATRYVAVPVKDRDGRTGNTGPVGFLAGPVARAALAGHHMELPAAPPR